jgi:fumarate reductase flavoprotein subunit
MSWFSVWGLGLAAAPTAADRGASVIVLDAGARTGGSAAISIGVVYGAGTSVQRQLGIEDGADAMFSYYISMNQWNVEAGGCGRP